MRLFCFGQKHGGAEGEAPRDGFHRPGSVLPAHVDECCFEPFMPEVLLDADQLPVTLCAPSLPRCRPPARHVVTPGTEAPPPAEIPSANGFPTRTAISIIRAPSQLRSRSMT